MQKIIKQCTFDKALRLKDRSVRLTFTTDLEQSSPEFMEMDEMLNSHGVLYYKDHGDLTQEEVDVLDDVDIELEGKTKSQRLRNVLYVYWEQKGDGKDFKQFYSDKMESLIEMIKSKLDE